MSVDMFVQTYLSNVGCMPTADYISQIEEALASNWHLGPDRLGVINILLRLDNTMDVVSAINTYWKIEKFDIIGSSVDLSSLRSSIMAKTRAYANITQNSAISSSELYSMLKEDCALHNRYSYELTDQILNKRVCDYYYKYISSKNNIDVFKNEQDLVEVVMLRCQSLTCVESVVTMEKMISPIDYTFVNNGDDSLFSQVCEIYPIIAKLGIEIRGVKDYITVSNTYKRLLEMCGTLGKTYELTNMEVLKYLLKVNIDEAIAIAENAVEMGKLTEGFSRLIWD